MQTLTPAMTMRRASWRRSWMRMSSRWGLGRILRTGGSSCCEVGVCGDNSCCLTI